MWKWFCASLGWYSNASFACRTQASIYNFLYYLIVFNIIYQIDWLEFVKSHTVKSLYLISRHISSTVQLCILQLFFYNDTMELVFAGAGALLFCGFIIFDTHMLMHKLSPEEHVLASINLYLDIVNLFIYVLRILDSMKKHWMFDALLHFQGGILGAMLGVV